LAKLILQTVEMKFNYQEAFPVRSADAYETLLWDVMKKRCHIVHARRPSRGGVEVVDAGTRGRMLMILVQNTDHNSKKPTNFRHGAF
jgi:hypothetical protein